MGSLHVTEIKSKRCSVLGELHDRTVYFIGNGTAHRSTGPAIVLDNGQWGWKLYGHYHRYYGPQSQKQDWWLHGKCIK